MWFRSKVLLSACKYLAFRGIFTRYFSKGSSFFVRQMRHWPANLLLQKSWRRLFLPTCVRVHRSQPSFLLIAHFPIATQSMHTISNWLWSEWGFRKSVLGLPQRPRRYTSSARSFRKDLHLEKNDAKKEKKKKEVMDGSSEFVWFFAWSPSCFLFSCGLRRGKWRQCTQRTATTTTTHRSFCLSCAHTGCALR